MQGEFNIVFWLFIICLLIANIAKLQCTQRNIVRLPFLWICLFRLLHAGCHRSDRRPLIGEEWKKGKIRFAEKSSPCRTYRTFLLPFILLGLTKTNNGNRICIERIYVGCGVVHHCKSAQKSRNTKVKLK